MKHRGIIYLTCVICIATLFSCTSEVYQDNVPTPPPSFELLTADSTGLSFRNTLYPSLPLNVFNYMYFYNGGGLAAGDFNNDGLTDLYFTANQLPNKLFLNRGNLHFEDVSDKAGAAGTGDWKTGVTTVDINNDGLLDLHISQVGEYRDIRGHNELLVCQEITPDGIPIYEEQSADYGLDLVGFGTQASFIDIDLDGDLDCFQMNHSLHQNGTFGQRFTFDEVHPTAGDRLLRNDDGVFTDITAESGIHASVIGYGLGIATSDINLDGYPDIYIANDFHENDYLYINNGDGTFTESLNDMLRHTSRFSMGVDIGDINNDGLGEIMSLDMHPEDPYILKSSLGEDDFGIFRFKLGYGYNHQYARNALHLNNGDSTFSEIGVYSGVHASDWSWATLFCDFDNDGLKDIFISNGIPKRMNDIDYVNFVSNDEVQHRINTDNMEETDLALIDKLPEIKLLNKFYYNDGDLHFTDRSEDIVNAMTSYSNGAIFADLDNDGDLDIVVNNIEDAPFIYKNTTREEGKGHYISLKLEGSQKNRRAIGAKVIVERGGSVQFYENFPVRGYQSTLTTNIHIGLGAKPDEVSQITVIWPDNTYEVVRTIPVDATLTLEYREGLPEFDYAALRPGRRAAPLQDITATTGIDFQHRENDFIDFNREQLVPHMASTEGPAVAVGDVNGDGLDDVYFGGAKWQHPALYVQGQDGQFKRTPQAAFSADTVCEDVDAVFIDVERDGDLDLFVVSGGNEFYNNMEPQLSRLYVNDGNGNFGRNRKAVDSLFLTGDCVAPADVNGDGYTDLFLGARATPWQYGVPPRSYLLINDGNGNLRERTSEWSRNLQDAGHVKDARWADLDNNGHDDLILALEWGPVTVFYNNGKRLSKKVLPGGNGWWNTAVPVDYDDDGDLDIAVGGPGENTKFKPSSDRPVTMYVNDFDGNEQVEQLVTYFLGDEEIPFPTYREVTRQMPEVKKKYLYAKDFAAASADELVGREKLIAASKLTAENFSHYILRNDGDGRTFSIVPLPARLQFSPVNDVMPGDFNNDGKTDLLFSDNFYGLNIELGRYDAGYGTILYGGEEQRTELLGLHGDKRGIKAATIAGKKAFIVARNDDTPLVLARGE